MIYLFTESQRTLSKKDKPGQWVQDNDILQPETLPVRLLVHSWLSSARVSSIVKGRISIQPPFPW